jgi:hypothetical protein
MIRRLDGKLPTPTAPEPRDPSALAGPAGVATSGAASSAAPGGAPDVHEHGRAPGIEAGRPSRALTEAGALATLDTAERLLAGLGPRLDAVQGQRLDAQLPVLSSALALVDRVAADLSQPGFGATAADAGAGSRLRALATTLAGGLDRLFHGLATTPEGSPGKARRFAAELLRTEARVLEATERAARPMAAPSDALPSSVLAEAVPEAARGPVRTAWAAIARSDRGGPSFFARHALLGVAAEALDHARRAAPDDAATRAVAHHGEALIRLRFGAPGEALDLLDAAAEAAGGRYPSLDYDRALVKTAVGDTRGAVRDLQAALVGAPSPDAAVALRRHAASEPGLIGLLSEPAFHALTAPVGGPSQTRSGALDHRGRALHTSPGWTYQLPVVEAREYLDETFGALKDAARAERRPAMDLHWFDDGRRGELFAETVPVDGVISDAVIASFEFTAGTLDVRLHRTERLLVDPAELHRVLSDVKLRDRID